MRLVLVPLKLLPTPQQLAVLVNFWSLIEYEQQRFEGPGGAAGGEDGFFELGFAAVDFADLEGDVPAVFQDAVEFVEDGGHGGLPVASEFFGDGDLNSLGIYAEEPAAEPVVAGVINDIQKRGRGDDQADGVGFYFRGGRSGLGEEERTLGDGGQGGADGGIASRSSGCGIFKG